MPSKNNYTNLISIIDRNTAEVDLKRQLLDRYENSYSTVKLLLDTGMRDYYKLCQINSNSVNTGILSKLKDRYYPSFSTILILFKSNKKAYDERH